MKEYIYILGVIAFILAGCYKDKGNYDYKKVNDLVSITFTPEPVLSGDSYSYEYRQPAMDTLRVTYSPVVDQSEVKDESNLEYQWIMWKTENKVTVYDTLFAKDLTLKFPPKKSSAYGPLFRVIDHSTGVEYYHKFSMKTKVPFINSWFVLHGQPGDRKLAVVEGVNEEEVSSIIYDVYMDMWGHRRFQNATRLHYVVDGSDFSVSAVEFMTVIQPDSCSYMHAFDLIVRKGFELMMPPVMPRPRLAYGASGEIPGGGNSLLVDQSGHFYWGKGDGWYFEVKTNEETEDYIADRIFLTDGNYVIVWDKVHRLFMYYDTGNNPWIRDLSDIRPADEGNAILKLFDEGTFADNEWVKQEILYMGQGNSNISEEGLAIVAQDSVQNSIVYQIGIGRKGGSSFIEVNKTPAQEMKLDASSQIATSFAFSDQVFYTRGSVVYLYNVVSGEVAYLYDAGGLITKLQFRISRNFSPANGIVDANKRLAIVVNNPDGTGELHEIFLDVAGDVERTMIHTGFGPIQDVAFAGAGMARY